MRILHRYLLREVGLQAALGLLIFTFVIFMQQVGPLLELTVRASSWSVLTVLLDAMPNALVYTLPMALLVGILIGLGRLGVDHELVAMRAAGVGSRQLVLPLLGFTGAVLALALSFTLWLAPDANRGLLGMESELAGSLALDVQPRVFIESLPGKVIYVDDTLPDGRWRKVLVADMTDVNSPRLALADFGQLVRLGPRLFQLHLENGAWYDANAAQPAKSEVGSFRSSDMPIDLGLARLPALTPKATPTRELIEQARFSAGWKAARIELYQRLALAFSCLALALAGIPMGLRAGRGGRAGGFVLTLAMVFGYYLLFLLGMRLAADNRVPAWLGLWGANIVFGGLGLWNLRAIDRMQSTSMGRLDAVARIRAAFAQRKKKCPSTRAYIRGWMPSLLEGYLMREFVGYTGLLLAAFLGMVLIFTTFELSGDLLHNKVAVSVLLRYLLYLSPQMLYMTIPVAILLGVLITFGLMSKSNEITALKACGVSVYRLIVPVLGVAALMGGFQFGLDATWLPAFNRKQDALRAQIKGRPPATHQTPGWQWVYGDHNDIFYFRFFDPGRNEFADLSVFEFDAQTFRLTRRLFAHDATWDDQLHAWVLKNGWERTFTDTGFAGFQTFLVSARAGGRETPAYFNTSSRLDGQGTQMTYGELRSYISSLQRAGYNVARLSVQLSKKIAYPLITLVMALLAFPFALTVGRRGTVAGITLGVGVAIFYWVSSGFLEALGNLNQLPALLAAWTPDLVFLLASVYLLLRVPT